MPPFVVEVNDKGLHCDIYKHILTAITLETPGNGIASGGTMAKSSVTQRKRVRSEGVRYAEVAALPWPVCGELTVTAFSTSLDAGRVPNATLLKLLSPHPEVSSEHERGLLLSASPDAGVDARTGLPAEFCMRELLNLDVSDTESTLAFMRSYGVVVAPYFGSHRAFARSCTSAERDPEWMDIEGDSLKAHLERAWLDILDECARGDACAPDGFRSLLRDSAWASEAMRSELACLGEDGRFAASWNEAVLALSLLRESVALLAAMDIASGDLQKAVSVMLEMNVMPKQVIGGFGWGDWCGMGAREVLGLGDAKRARVLCDMVQVLENQQAVSNACMFVNAMAFDTGQVLYTGFRAYLPAAEFEFSHGLFPGGAGYSSVREAESALDPSSCLKDDQGSLGAALSLQLVAAIDSDRSWRRCARAGCQHYFKQYRRFDGSASSRRKRDALLCSQSCQQQRMRAVHSAALKELDRRIDLRAQSAGAMPDDEWLRAIADDINRDERYMSLPDLSRSRLAPAGGFSPLHPTLTPKDCDRAKWRLASRRSRFQRRE